MIATRSAMLVIALVVGVVGCQSTSDLGEEPVVHCVRFEGPDCTNLAELGHDALISFRADVPSTIVVGSACPDNARCLPSVLGGEEAAVIVRWPDATVRWAKVPLAADWPAAPAGEAVVQVGPPPAHLEQFITGPTRS